jgi:hypothetical protein
MASRCNVSPSARSTPNPGSTQLKVSPRWSPLAAAADAADAPKADDDDVTRGAGRGPGASAGAGVGRGADAGPATEAKLAAAFAATSAAVLAAAAAAASSGEASIARSARRAFLAAVLAAALSSFALGGGALASSRLGTGSATVA